MLDPSLLGSMPVRFVQCFYMQCKFKNPLVEAQQFYLQYKLPSELYPINIELCQKRHVEAAFKKFAALDQARKEVVREKIGEDGGRFRGY